MDTALHCAVMVNNVDIVKLLVQADPTDPHTQNEMGRTPMYMAVEEEYDEIIEVISKSCTAPSLDGPDGSTVVRVNNLDDQVESPGGSRYRIMDRDALFVAAIAGDGDAIAKLDMEADKLDRYERTILHTESMNGNTEHVRFILREFANKNLLVKLGNQQENALAWAAYYGHTEVVGLLIEAARDLPPDPITSVQAYLRHADQDSETALHAAIKGGSLDAVKLLVEADPTDTHIQNKLGETPMYMAVENGYTEIVEVISKTCKACFLDGPDGSTALHAAVKNDDDDSLEVVKVLIDAARRLPPSADPDNDITDSNAVTSFQSASDNDNTDHDNDDDGDSTDDHTDPNRVTSFQSSSDNDNNDDGDSTDDHTDPNRVTSIQSSSDDESINDNPVSPFQAFLRRVDEDGNTALHIAVMLRSLDVTKLLLESDPSFEGTRNQKGETPMYMAVENGYNDIVELISKTCKACSLDGPDGSTALHAAVKNDNDSLEVVRVLIDHAARRSPPSAPDNDITDSVSSLQAFLRRADEDGNTALHIAVMQRNLNIAKLLVESDSSFEGTPNQKGRTPFYIAVEKEHADTAKMLCTTCATPRFLVGPAVNLTALHAVVKNLYEDAKDVIKMIIDQIKKHNTNVLPDEIFYETDEDGYTVLEVAVELNQMPVVTLLLDLQHPAASKRKDGAFISLMPVIYKAQEKDYKKIVDLLNQRYDDGSKLSKDFKDQVSLISAIKSGKTDTVVSLLSDAGRGAQRLVTFVDKLGWTALHHAVYHESIPIIKHIAEAQKGIKPKSGYKDKVPTPFHVAVQKERTSIVILLMQLWPSTSSTYTAVDKKGQNILHLAALQSKKDMIEGILKNCPAEHKKEFVNKQNNNGYTTLHLLIQRGCFVPELLKYEGLDTSVKNNEDWTPWDMLYVQEQIVVDQVKIKVALDHIQIDGKKDIFSSSVFTTSEREKKDVKFREQAQKMIDGMLALMKENTVAVAKCYTDAIGGDPISRAALEMEADTPNKAGETILHVESIKGAVENVRFILSAFAKKNLLVRLDNRKQSALYLAAHHGHAKVVEALLGAAKRNLPPSSALDADFKALFQRSDESGRTPLELAMSYNHVNAVELILLADPAYQDGRGSRNQGLLRLIYQAKENKYNDKIVELLSATFETGIDPNLKGVLGLIVAIQRGDAGPISQLLRGEDNKHFLNFVDSEGWTLLHHAAYHQFDSILSEMIEAQEKVGYQFVCGERVATPFHVAARCGHTSTLIRLLRLWPSSSSRYTTVDENGQNIMQAAPSPYTAVDENGQNILHLAALTNKKEMVNGIFRCCPSKQKNLLLSKRDDNGNTPLHLLVAQGCFIEDLIKYIAAGDTTNNDNCTPRDMLYSQHNIVGDQVQIKMALDDINTDQSRKLWSGSRKRSISSSLAVLPASRREKKDILFNDDQNKLREKKNAKMQEDLQRYREGTNSQIVVSALITTITFTVGFTIPGGLHQSGESNQGLAVLSKKAAFKIFMIADAFALLLSICALFIYFLENMSQDLEHVTRLHATTMGLNIASVMLTMFVFMTGTYVVLSKSLSLSITICAVGSLFFIFVIVQLLRIAYEWRVRKYNDYKKEA
nr:PREDICTED: serine/threonine-protein phosphatase 6 regulatory ankyrin repeat subunit B-like [Daucus carota subsp. sativus]